MRTQIHTSIRLCHLHLDIFFSVSLQTKMESPQKEKFHREQEKYLHTHQTIHNSCAELQFQRTQLK